jgi:glycosyltransferase involved in cell wall biosynthesis
VKISIVTISYNQAPFLEQAIRSIVDQDYNGLEYIVVDPGSTDGSREIIKRHASRIASTVLEPDRGPADGLNKGFAQATGDVFGFINADDALLPGALRKVAEYFRANPQVDIACGRGYTIDGEGRPLRRIVPTRLSPRLYAYGAVNFFQQGMFFRRSAYRKTRGFNVDNRSCWDSELALDMLLNGSRVGMLHEELALFRIHDASISGSGRLLEIYRRDCARQFKKVMGREMNGLDHVRAKAYLLEKWLTHPGVALQGALRRLG